MTVGSMFCSRFYPYPYALKSKSVMDQVLGRGKLSQGSAIRCLVPLGRKLL